MFTFRFFAKSRHMIERIFDVHTSIFFFKSRHDILPFFGVNIMLVDVFS